MWTIRKGKRIFAMAPLHHHFQLRGWAENKIVVRFWIASASSARASCAPARPCSSVPAAACCTVRRVFWRRLRIAA